MKANLRSRNIGLNSYVAMLVVTTFGAFCTLYFLHVLYELPLTRVTSVTAYASIDASL